MARRGRPPKVQSIPNASVVEAGVSEVVSSKQFNEEASSGNILTMEKFDDLVGQEFNRSIQEPLPAQPISRLRLLEVIRDTLRTPDGKTGITLILDSKRYLNEMAEDVDDQTLQNIIFKEVRDGDERAIVRRFFSNLNE